ncbi:MAG: GNAT family N-acetyltransferase [Planctomycetota bacterium]|nr:GNAT family N-acetyltransferase [Planctomycetota bacterium]
MSARRSHDVRLRLTTLDDIERLFQIQLDPLANTLAGTKPRDRAAFEALWATVLSASPAEGYVPRTIVADDRLAGSIGVFKRDERSEIGYWIAREHWGQGIATRALSLMLEEVRARPLFASVVSHNDASLRVLARNGFVQVTRQHCSETERYLAGEVITLRLDS